MEENCVGRNESIWKKKQQQKKNSRYGVPFSHLFTELEICPIEVHISLIQVQISTIDLHISIIQLEISPNRLNCR